MKRTKNNILKYLLIMFILFIGIVLSNNVYGVTTTENTKAYFLSKVTRGYGQADCILLENTDNKGNKVFGLIDTGRQETKEYMVNYLKEKGVKKLEFVLLTHNHADHTGGMTELLGSDIEIKKIFYKAGDSKYSLNWNTSQYKNIVKKAIEKSIPIYGSYIPSRTLNVEDKEEFKNILRQYQDCVVGDNIIANDADFTDFLYNNRSKILTNNLLNKFDSSNTIIKLGDANIRLYNWEIFDEKGNVWTKESNINREVVKDENNNSIVALLVQGNKRALFTGDMNNLDENKNTGRIGDEDRLKDVIGDVDFLKLGHHGYQYSNTIDYLNTIKPEYAIITNDIGNAYGETYAWLEQNNVEFFYSTEDEKSIVLTITNDNIGLNYETVNEFKNIHGNIKYLRNDNAVSWKEIDTNLNYIKSSKIVNTWDELKSEIEKNKATIKYNGATKNIEGESLKLILSSKGDWNANSEIIIEKGQDITIIPENLQDIKITRHKDYKGNLISVNGTLTLGKQNMNSKLILDGGDKNSIIAEGCLITCNDGIINLYDNVYLQNNNRMNNKANSANDYNTYGSAVYVCNLGTFNMYGGSIINNTANNTSKVDINNKTSDASTYVDIYGVGICCAKGTINITGGNIKDNVAKNDSEVKFNAVNGNWYLSQKMCGIGIYAYKNSKVNISNDVIISNNKTINNATTVIEGSRGATLNRTIYGIGINIDNSVLDIKNADISNNTGENTTTLSLKNKSNIQTLNSTVRGGGIYATSSNVKIMNAHINNNDINSANSVSIENGSSIKSNDTTRTTGGGIDAYNSKFELKGTNISNNYATAGGGFFVDYLSTMNVTNSTLSHNKENNIGMVSSANISITIDKEEIKQEPPTTDKDNNNDISDNEQEENKDTNNKNDNIEEEKKVQYVEKDNTIANGRLPQTGEKVNVLPIIALITIALYCTVKIYKNREI